MSRRDLSKVPVEVGQVWMDEHGQEWTVSSVAESGASVMVFDGEHPNFSRIPSADLKTWVRKVNV